MKQGRFAHIPETAADVRKLCRQGSIPLWNYPPDESLSEEFRAEMTALEAVGFVIDGSRVIVPAFEHANWSIGVYSGPSPAALAPAAEACNPVISWHDVTDASAVFVADPFVIRSSGLFYLFFEMLNWKTNRGEIAVASSSDGVSWQYQRTVLSEPFHLSYPFVFYHEDAFYMIPETHQARGVRLYRATDFPWRWEFITELVKATYIADSTFVVSDNHYYLFADTSAAYDHSRLELYHSDRLTGPWILHPASPIIQNDPHYARPAGRIISYEGRFVRFAQDCRIHYGSAVSAFLIDRLSPHEYHETLWVEGVLRGSGRGWNSCGMHHVDAIEAAPGRWIAYVDGWTLD